MALAVLSFDVALDSPARAQLFAEVRAATGARTTWRLLTRLWMVRFASIADFERFGDALEGLHRAHPAEFDYFALHFDAAGGPVVIAPNPAARTPSPIAAAAVARAVGASARRATVRVDDPLPVLAQLRELHEFDDWEARLAARLGVSPRARRARRGAGARARKRGGAGRGSRRRGRPGR